MNTFRPKHFILQELVGPEFFAKWGERAWEWLRPELLETIDQLRRKFGSITINNWHNGGVFKESGLRDFSANIGAEFSMHKFGVAMDCKFKDILPPLVQEHVLQHANQFPLLTCMEDAMITKTWLHVDVRNHGQPGIWIVKP